METENEDLRRNIRMLNAHIDHLEDSLTGARRVIATLLAEESITVKQRDHYRRWAGRWKRIAREIRKERCSCGR